MRPHHGGHLHVMSHVLCEPGYPLSLRTAAKAMGLPAMTEAMTGVLAPPPWAKGDRQQVLDQWFVRPDSVGGTAFG